MKKYIAFLLMLGCVWSLCGCGANTGNPPAKAEEFSFTAEVLEVYDGHFYVKPTDSSSDKVEVPINDGVSWPIPQVGDTVTIVSDGKMLYTNPPCIANVYRVEITSAAD